MASHKSYKVYALVKENDKGNHAFTLTNDQFNELGEDDIEQMVQEWCEKNKLTYVAYAM